MKPEIRISLIDVDGDECQFQIALTNCITSITIEFYHYADAFKSFGEKLKEFPQDINEKIRFEIGEDSAQWAYYILLEVTASFSGPSIIQIKVDNHGKAPYTNKAEFFMTAYPASINELGQLLCNWNPIHQKDLKWKAD